MFRVQVGDLMEGDPIGQLMGDERADIIYSDPPWGQGNLTYWRTYNGERSEHRWSDFLARFCDAVDAYARPDAHILVEMGLRWIDELAAQMAARGRPEVHRQTCYYGSPRLPNVLWYSGPGAPFELERRSGVAMTREALSHVARPGAIVLDPCCGKGMTARCALRLGMRFRGNELNPRRLATTRDWCDRFARGMTR